MNAKHKPGPWKYRAIPEPEVYHSFWIDDDNGAPIGEVRNIGETTEANARLIAAAPDLLAVCQHIAKWTSVSDLHFYPDLMAAIAKATGQEPTL